VIEHESDGAYLMAAQLEMQEEWRIDPRFLELFRQFVAASQPGE
jgi:hypothetical protein